MSAIAFASVSAMARARSRSNAEAKASFSRSPRAARTAFMRSRISGDWSWKILNTWSRCASLRSR